MSNRIHFKECIVCGGTDFKNEIEVTDWLVSDENFLIKECLKCSFRFTADPPTVNEAGPYYETEEYVEHSDNADGIINTIYHHARKWMVKHKLRLIQRENKGNHLLDVGSGAGYFLNFMKNSGYDANGVEISQKAVDSCYNKYGIRAFHPDKLIAKEISGKFDVITMWHVFEHVYSHNEYFSAFEHLLEDDGILVVAMPNYHCLEEKMYRKYWNGYDAPRHLWHFTPSTFTSFASDRGFTVTKMKSLPLDPFYNCMISASYKKSLTLLPITFIKGLMSFITAKFSFKKSSSIVYILRKDKKSKT